MTFKKILVTTDFSDESRVAIQMAKDLGTLCGSKISLVHVTEFAPAYSHHTPTDQVPSYEGYKDDVRKQAQTAIDQLKGETLGDYPDAEALNLENRSVWRGVCEQAESMGADVIVVATHGRTGFAHAVIGSVAERILRHAPCPVLTVRVGEPA